MTFLRPVAMVKVALVGLKDDRETILTVLHDLGVVQIEPLSKASLDHYEPERASDVGRAVNDQLIRFRGLRAALPPVGAGAPRYFSGREALLDAAKTVTIDEEVGQLKREEDHLLTERKQVQDHLDLLEKFNFYTDRLELLTGKNVLSFFGEAPRETFDAIKAELARTTDSQLLESPGPDTVRFLLAVRATQAETVSRFAQQKGVSLIAAPELQGPPAEAIHRLKTRAGEIDLRMKEIEQRLTELSREWYPTVLALEEGFAIENRKLEAWTRMGTSKSTFILEGWVPKRSRAQLEEAIGRTAGNRAQVYELTTDEEPPTKMDNPVGIKWYEFFIRFYSLPISSEWDPTWVFAIVFPIFFAFMLGDWGYALVILLISLWMIRGFPARQVLPKSIKNFVKLIMGPNAMRQLAYALVPGTLLGIAIGLYFDEFFGVHLLKQLFGYDSPADPVKNIRTLLLIAGYVGLGMVVFGFSLGALNEYFHRHWKGAIAKVGGIAMAFGIAGFGLAVLHRAASLSNPFLFLWLGLLVAGAVMMFVEGFQHFLMGGIEVVSHILSFTRLVGILLASVILALVINTVSYGLIAGHGPLGAAAVVFAFLGILILVVGQMFNLILGVFEPGIQGARLIFVEYFSKFYTGNGKEFRPFGSRRTHTSATEVTSAVRSPAR